MTTDTKIAYFRKSHPIDFALTDPDEQAVLYIAEDATAHTLHLTIENTSAEQVSMLAQGAGGSQKSAGDHHFALRFRPGTLSASTIDLLCSSTFQSALPTPDWELTQLARPAPSEPITLYLRYTGSDTMLAPGKPRTLTLSGFSAAPGSGSRGTQVELIPHQLTYASGDATPITGSRTQFVHVTNHTGQKNIPLHVGFSGGNTVLSDGKTATPLTLRLTNIYRGKDLSQSGTITFRGSRPDHSAPSRLSLSYDAGDADWSLAKTGAAQAATLTARNASGYKQTATLSGAQGDAPAWEIVFDKDVPLAPGQSLEIDVTGLVTSARVGPANLYLHYNGVPGYWDGQFVAVIQKTPLVVRADEIGIHAPLTAQGPLRVEGLSTLSSVVVTGAASEPGNASDAGGNVQVGKGVLRLGWNEAGGWIQTHETKPLLLNAGGNNVGIGTAAPTEKLSVEGPTRMNFGVGGQLVFQGNTDDNPGVFVLGRPGAEDKSKGLTISGKGGARLPVITLNTDTLLVPSTIAGVSRDADQWTKEYPALKTKGTAIEYLTKSFPQSNPAILRSGGGSKEHPEGHDLALLVHGLNAPNFSDIHIVDLTTGILKTFIVDHPLHADRYLLHATLEGPEGGVYYRGTARLHAGRALVTLPDYFEALTCRDGRTILLTNLDGFDPLAVETQAGEKIRDGRFCVVSSNPASTQAFDWEVKAVRQDGALDVEPAKEALRVERFGPYTYGIPTQPSSKKAR